MADVPEDATPDEVFNRLRIKLPDLATNIDALVKKIKNSPATKFEELTVMLNKASDSMKSMLSMSEAAGIENFVKYVSRKDAIACFGLIASSLTERVLHLEYPAKLSEEDLNSPKILLLRHAKEFALLTIWASGTIALLGDTFIFDNITILVHSFSGNVLELLIEAAKRKNIEVLFTDGSETGRQLSRLLKKDHGISTCIVHDREVAEMMKKVDFVLVGAYGVDLRGGIFSQRGTLKIAALAMKASVLFYAVAETFKFGARQGSEANVEYTPDKYVDMIISDSGALFPSEIKDELTHLYAGRFPL